MPIVESSTERGHGKKTRERGETKHAQWAIRSGAGGALEIDRGPALTLSLRLASSNTSLTGVDLEPDGMLPLDPHARRLGTITLNPTAQRTGNQLLVARGMPTVLLPDGRGLARTRLEGGLGMFQ